MSDRLQFYVQEKESQRADRSNSVSTPDTYPSFVLVFNGDWNDYGYRTWFALWYFDERGRKNLLGELKIMCRGETNTFNHIPHEFSIPLPEEYCSLGLSSSYYHGLQNELGKEQALQVLKYLRDCSVDISIQEEFENDDVFKNSLLRDQAAERALRDARLILEERGTEKAYSFEFNFPVTYSDGTSGHQTLNADWDVDIKYFPKDFDRIIGVIGENGVGKTTMLRAFVSSMVSDEPEGFSRKPLFNSISVISSTNSDRYPEPQDHSPIIYTIHTLDQNEANVTNILRIAKTIEKSKKLINGETKISIYREMIISMVGKEANGLFEKRKVNHPLYTQEVITIRDDRFQERLKHLSSGQLHILAMVTYLIADMHVGALVIIDEPEVHLHPSSIVYFMLHLYNLLKQFDAYSFIATHSPLIVREILKENVYQFIRTRDDIPLVGKVSHDTFGEDISILYDKIFGYNESLSIFSLSVKHLIRRGKTRAEIEKTMTSDNKMNLNARLRIFDMYNTYQRLEKNNPEESPEDA